MNEHRNRAGVNGRGWTSAVILGLGLAFCAGCAQKQLVVFQDPVINNAGDARGEPLELNVVVCYEKDLKAAENEDLRPDANVTAAKWYRKRPQQSGDMAGRFRLPSNQIYLLTSDNDFYGKKIAGVLRGAKTDGKDTLVCPGTIEYKKDWDTARVIYVFPKFTDREGKVLDVPPAKFERPEKYPEKLEVRVGVNQNRRDQPPDYGQYISINAK